MSYSELDLQILKAITTNKKHALDFINDCQLNVISQDLWSFTNLVVGYIKTYKNIPTLKILQDKAAKINSNLEDTVNSIWIKLENTKIDDKEFAFNVEKIKQRFADDELNRLKNILSVENADQSINSIEKTLRNIKSLTTVKTYDRKTLKDCLDDFKEEINAKLLDPNFGSGILTGYSFIDEATDGFRPGELILIGGESGSGKSLLLSNMAVQIWLQGNTIDQKENFTQGYNVLYFSLEMPFGDCRNRIFARMAGVPSKILKRPITKKGRILLTGEHKNKLATMAKFIKNYPYQFEIVDLPRGATPEVIETLMEESIIQYHPDVVVIDYLGIMDMEGNEDDWLKLGNIAASCHELTRVHNIVGLSAVQLNRTKASGKDTEDKVGLHRIGRSSLIMHHSNLGLQIETRPNEKNYPTMNCYIIKNRNGENMVKGSLLKNLACGSLLNTEPEKTDEQVEFYDVDDMSKPTELFEFDDE